MPTFNLGEIMSMATQDIGRRADIPQSVVSQRANLAYFMVADSERHALQERIAISSTTSGENRIDLPADFDFPIQLSMFWSWSTASSTLSFHKTLKRMSVSEVDAVGFLPVGEPVGVVFYNTWMELYPSPNSAYSLQLRYQSMVTDLLELTDVPSISTPWRYPIVLKTKELLYNYLGNEAGAVFARQQFLDEIMRLKSDEARRQSGEFRHSIVPVYFSPRARRNHSSSWSFFNP